MILFQSKRDGWLQGGVFLWWFQGRIALAKIKVGWISRTQSPESRAIHWYFMWKYVFRYSSIFEIIDNRDRDYDDYPIVDIDKNMENFVLGFVNYSMFIYQTEFKILHILVSWLYIEYQDGTQYFYLIDIFYLSSVLRSWT